MAPIPSRSERPDQPTAPHFWRETSNRRPHPDLRVLDGRGGVLPQLDGRPPRRIFTQSARRRAASGVSDGGPLAIRRAHRLQWVIEDTFAPDSTRLLLGRCRTVLGLIRRRAVRAVKLRRSLRRTAELARPSLLLKPDRGRLSSCRRPDSSPTSRAYMSEVVKTLDGGASASPRRVPRSLLERFLSPCLSRLALSCARRWLARSRTR